VGRLQNCCRTNGQGDPRIPTLVLRIPVRTNESDCAEVPVARRPTCACMGGTALVATFASAGSSPSPCRIVIAFGGAAFEAAKRMFPEDQLEFRHSARIRSGP
jgi:hypothetical protein